MARGWGSWWQQGGRGVGGGKGVGELVAARGVSANSVQVWEYTIFMDVRHTIDKAHTR